MSMNLSAGNASNVANFESFISSAIGFGDSYKPSEPTLKIEAMKEVLAEGKNVMRMIKIAIPNSKNAKTARDDAFDLLYKRVTRVVNAFEVNIHNEQSQSQLRTLNRVLQGSKLKSKKKPEVKADPEVAVKQNVSHKSDFENRLESFDAIIQFLATFPAYAPNEPELTVAGLTDFYNELKSIVSADVNAEVALENARAYRNVTLFTPVTGLAYVGKNGKLYVKSAYGPRSPQYKQIAKLRFTIHKI